MEFATDIALIQVEQKRQQVLSDVEPQIHQGQPQALGQVQSKPSSSSRLALSVGPVASLLLGSQVGRTDLLQELIKLSDADAGEGLEVTRFAPQLGEGNHEPSLPYFASGLKNESMISGFVSNGYPVIAVTFQRPGQPVFQLECVIDTGFAGYLTLLLQAVQAMQLPFFYQMVINLANSSRTITDVYTRQIIWHDTKRQVEVLAMGTRPLVGRALLTGNSLSIDFRDGGEVRIERH